MHAHRRLHWGSPSARHSIPTSKEQKKHDGGSKTAAQSQKKEEGGRRRPYLLAAMTSTGQDVIATSLTDELPFLEGGFPTPHRSGCAITAAGDAHGSLARRALTVVALDRTGMLTTKSFLTLP